MKLYLQIAVQPYLKHYLAFHHQIEPFKLTEKNRFGSYLINCLCFKTKSEMDKAGMPKMRYLTETIQVELPEHYWWNYGTVIPEKAQYRFNNFLLDEFQDRMVNFVKPYIKRKGDLNMLLLNFRSHYSISEDELPLKTLQKAYQRESHRLTICKSA